MGLCIPHFLKDKLSYENSHNEIIVKLSFILSTFIHGIGLSQSNPTACPNHQKRPNVVILFGFTSHTGEEGSQNLKFLK